MTITPKKWQELHNIIVGLRQKLSCGSNMYLWTLKDATEKIFQGYTNDQLTEIFQELHEKQYDFNRVAYSFEGISEKIEFEEFPKLENFSVTHVVGLVWFIEVQLSGEVEHEFLEVLKNFRLAAAFCYVENLPDFTFGG